MRTHHIYNLVFIMAAIFLGGCKKELNVNPTSQEVDGNIITDTKSATTVLNGVYYRFAAGGADNNSVPSTLWSQTNETIPSQLSGMLSYTSGGGLSEHTYNATSAGIDYVWNYGYNLVNAANGFLKNIAGAGNVDAATRRQMIAEAKFLRAFGNSELLLYYGQYYDTSSNYGIILRNEFVDPSNIYLPRSKVGTVYDSIFSDLDNAIQDLPGKNSSIAFANTWAAKLLKARMLINRGAPSDYTQIITITTDIIANSPFSLESNVKNLFLSKGLTSNELILGIQPYSTQNYKWKNDIYSNYYSPNAFMDSLFNGDPRTPWYIQRVKTREAVTKYYPGSVTTVAAAAISENSYAFRLTEAYLLKAEALVSSGGSLTDAKNLVRTVLTNAGVTNFSTLDDAGTSSEVLIAVISEEMKSFVSESGQDWFAIRRLPFATVQRLLPSVINKSLLILPIPQAEILTNGKMIQNPNY